LARNNGTKLMTISLETSIRKLAMLTAHTLRGRLLSDGRGGVLDSSPDRTASS